MLEFKFVIVLIILFVIYVSYILKLNKSNGDLAKLYSSLMGILVLINAMPINIYSRERTIALLLVIYIYMINKTFHKVKKELDAEKEKDADI